MCEPARAVLAPVGGPTSPTPGADPGRGGSRVTAAPFKPILDGSFETTLCFHDFAYVDPQKFHLGPPLAYTSHQVTTAVVCPVHDIIQK